jgi:hypothetical protein
MDAPTTQQVAEVITGINAIGEAQRALEAAGWRVTIAANRITVNSDVFAQLLPTAVGPMGTVNMQWTVYAMTNNVSDGSRPPL